MQNQLRIQIDDGPIEYLPDLGFHLMESPDILVPEQREYETERYPEHDGVKIYPYTTYEPFEYTCKLLFFGSIADMNNAVRILWERMFETIVHGGIRRAKEVRIFNDYKGIQVVGYAMSMPGSNTYVQVFGSDPTDRDSAWECDFTVYVADPTKCIWAGDVVGITYSIPGAIPAIKEQRVRAGISITLPTPSQLGMWMPPEMQFAGWLYNGAIITEVVPGADIYLTARIEYGEDAFYVSPEHLEIGYDDITTKQINVFCPDQTWQVSAGDPSWVRVEGISGKAAAITLTRNNATEDRSQNITFTWTSPTGTSYSRIVSITQLMSTEVIENITASITLVGSDTGLPVAGVDVELQADGIILVSGKTNSSGVFSGTWPEEQSHYESFQELSFVTYETPQYDGNIFTIDEMPTFDQAVQNGINIGVKTIDRKIDYVTIFYQIPEATPTQGTQQVVRGETIYELPTPAQVGLILPSTMEFNGWTLNGSKVTTITPNTNITLIGDAIYAQSAFAVTPEEIEMAWNDSSVRTFHVTCPDNLWEVGVPTGSWLTATKTNANTVAVSASNNTGEVERNETVTFSWFSPKGQQMTRTTTVVQLPYIEVLESLVLRIELDNTDQTSIMDHLVEFSTDNIVVSSGRTNNNGIWTGRWSVSRESYETVQAMKFSSPETDLYYSGLWPVSPIPQFDSAVANGIDMGTVELIAKPQMDSYWVDVNGVKHEFTANNTPISRFSVSITTNPITIEGQAIGRGLIYGLVFGPIYLNTAAFSFGSYFLRYFESLRYLVFARYSSNPIDVIFGSTESYVMQQCNNLVEIDWGSIQPTITSNSRSAFNAMQNNNSCIMRFMTQGQSDRFSQVFGTKLNLWQRIIG